MPFNSYLFLLVFLPIVWVGLWRLQNTRWAKWWLLGADIVFLLCLDYRYVPLLLAVVVATWMISKTMMQRQPDNRLWCFAGILLLVANFAAFKYLSLANLAAPVAEDRATVAILPLGISFITFNLIGLLVDIYRGRVTRPLAALECLSFAGCFAYVMAGPLVRLHEVRSALKGEGPTRGPQIVRGLFLLSVGLAKKVLLADEIGRRVDHLLTFTDDRGLVGAWLVMTAFAAQIYFDFSGYSDMAVGVGSLLGFDLPQNFASPYRATNPPDFWRRWHMSLTAWVRDYVYLSLGLGRSKVRAVFNTFVAMLMVGLWHGTTWTFALWGLYHASLLAGYHVLQMIHGVRRIRVPVLLARIGMFASVTLGWALFRAHSLAASGSMLAALIGLQGRGSLAVALNQAGRSLPLIVAFALVLTQLVPEPYEVHVRPAPWAAVALGVLFAISFASMAGSNPFLYLQF